MVLIILNLKSSIMFCLNSSIIQTSTLLYNQVFLPLIVATSLTYISFLHQTNKHVAKQDIYPQIILGLLKFSNNVLLIQLLNNYLVINIQLFCFVNFIILTIIQLLIFSFLCFNIELHFIGILQIKKKLCNGLRNDPWVTHGLHASNYRNDNDNRGNGENRMDKYMI